MFALTSAQSFHRDSFYYAYTFEREMAASVIPIAITGVFIFAMVYTFEKVQDLRSVLQTCQLSKQKHSLDMERIMLKKTNTLYFQPPGFHFAGICIIDRRFMVSIISLFTTYTLLTWDHK
ncbi:uncharacterized protein LOC129594721 [Paramacrobiotus metropolitanus]|uniref:uncharacterized protein LOC129594721 n=1 Tax=Paramacrobiotus metropolitanus TaxID=2943436 RepID=UPI002445FFDD|nr:uncharacterized protein LOC129594721 [Paramacrobiotus metropolitanus]